MASETYWTQPVTLAQIIGETLNWYSRNPDAAGPRLDALQRALPSGSGIDSGTTIDRPGALPVGPESAFRLTADYHAMDSSGYYAGWSTFYVDVLATFSGPVVELSWADGKGPAQDYDDPEIPCEECTHADDPDDCHACAGSGSVPDPDAEWCGVGDPTDSLIDVYDSALRAMVCRLDFDSPPAVAYATS